MPAIFRNLRFAWEYFVQRKHRLDGYSPSEILEKLDWHENSLVGKYVQTQNDTWWSDTPLEGLNYPVRLLAPGSEPIREQIEAFARLVGQLPQLIQDSEIGPPPKDDGWGNSPPPFDISTAPVSSITMQDDGGYFLIFEVEDPNDAYILAPSFDISHDLRLLLAEWSV